MYHEGRTYVFYRFRAPVANKTPQPLSPFFFKCWYVMFLLAIYSSSNSLRTLMLKETSRHFSFSVFLFCSCILPILLGGEVLTFCLSEINLIQV